MYRSQLQLRHAITPSELGFITHNSRFCAVRRNSNGVRVCLQVRCDASGGNGEQKVPKCKPSPLWNCDQFAKRLSRTERRLVGAGIVVTLAGVAWFRNLGAAGLVDDTEPLFAEAARQMLVTGDYITPQFNAQPRFDKPILIYWLMALSGKLLGPSVWALRLPSAVCALGLLLGLLVTVKEFGLSTPKSDEPSPSADHYIPAVITIAAFSLNLEVVAWGSTALSDMLLTSMLGASLLSFFWGYAGQKLIPHKHEWGYSLSAIFMSVACLSKGPVGIAFPVLVCAFFLLSTGELFQVLTEEIPYKKGVLAVLLINLPWYGIMTAKHGLTYIQTFFGYHNIERFMRGVNHHGGRPWWYGLAVVAILYFPWSWSLPRALLQAWTFRKTTERFQKLPLFAACWLVAGFLLFALSSSQLPSYYLPLAPAIALLAASTQEKPGRIVPGVLYLLLAVGFGVLPGFLQSSGDAVAAEIGRLVIERRLREVAVVLFALAAIITLRRPREMKKTQWLVHTIVMACFIGMFVTPVYRLTDTVRQAPLRHVAYAAATHQRTGEPLVMVGTRMPSVVFYSKLPTAFFDSPREAVVAIHDEAALWVSSALIITETDAGLFQPPPDILATSGNYKLLRLHRRPN